MVVLTAVAICGKLAEQCLKLMVKLRVERSGCAPLVFPTDGNVFKVGSFLRRIGSVSFVGIGAVVLLGVCILPAEIAADFGVEASYKCTPRREESYGICGGLLVSTMNSRSKQLSTAFSIENLAWNNQHLIDNPIRQGLHKNCDGTEYFGSAAKRNLSLPIAVTGCFVTKATLMDSNRTDLTFGGAWFMSGEGVGLLQVNTGIGKQRNTLEGPGGVFYNYAYYSSFMVVGQPDGEDLSSRSTIIEYADGDHIEAILRTYNNSNPQKISVRARGPLYSYDVGCRVSSLKSGAFADGLFSYRYAQLSRSSKRKGIPRVNLTCGTRTIPNVPQPFNVSDVIRATLAAKVSKPISCYGETFAYTQCGEFKWPLGYPLMVIFSVLLVLAVALGTYAAVWSDSAGKTPLTANAWALYVLRECNHEGVRVEMGSELYKEKFQRYGHRRFMGEYFKDAHTTFLKLRFISFLKPEYQKRRQSHEEKEKNISDASENAI